MRIVVAGGTWNVAVLWVDGDGAYALRFDGLAPVTTTRLEGQRPGVTDEHGVLWVNTVRGGVVYAGVGHNESRRHSSYFSDFMIERPIEWFNVKKTEDGYLAYCDLFQYTSDSHKGLTNPIVRSILSERLATELYGAFYELLSKHTTNKLIKV